MSPLRHIVVSSVLAAILFPFFGIKVLMVFVGGVLIDIDHYFWFVAKKKDTSIARCQRFYERVMVEKRMKDVLNALFIFHTLEFLIIIAVASFFSEYALMFLVGYVFHIVPDIIFEVRMWKRKVVAFSVLQWVRLC
ncbi:hypothetical protein HY638_00540 [Candidatus Woesearchaeota archaeon]|nr:hypothetical protein [Candidatus Woesearchaeota archaeon]